jgi:hypothetical protein
MARSLEKFRTIKKDDVYVIKPCYSNIDYKVDFENEYTSCDTSELSIFKNKYINSS